MCTYYIYYLFFAEPFPLLLTDLKQHPPILRVVTLFGRGVGEKEGGGGTTTKDSVIERERRKLEG